MIQYDSLHINVEGAVNGYRVNVYTEAPGIWKENTDTYLQALRLIESRINGLIIDELQKLQQAFKEAV